MNKENLKILLLQIRHDPAVRAEEHMAFAKYSGLPIDQIHSLNAINSTEINSGKVDNYHALFIGGTSESSVLEPEKNPYLQDCYKLIRHCLEVSKPVFASCFGFQMAIMALGGEITHQAHGFEMGTLPISLNKSAKSDPLLCHTPDGFYAVTVHKEKATTLPENCESLAYTDQCIHAFKVKDKPFWGFQFHPEVDKETLVYRLGVYKERYTENAKQFEYVIANAQATPHSNILVKNFIDHLLTLQP